MSHRQYVAPDSSPPSALSRRGLLMLGLGVVGATVSGQPRAEAETPRRLGDVLQANQLVLDDGQEVWLPDILPDGADRHPPQVRGHWSKTAQLSVRQWAGERPLSILTLTPAQDRYGRLRADLLRVSDDDSLVDHLVRDGLVRVFPEPDSSVDRVQRLLSLEEEARASGRGAWGDGTFQILTDSLSDTKSDQFVIVEGTVQRVSRIGRRWHLEFGADWRSDLTLGLNAPVYRRLEDEGTLADSLAGQKVQARGWVRFWNGPYIELVRRDQLELIAP